MPTRSHFPVSAVPGFRLARTSSLQAWHGCALLCLACALLSDLHAAETTWGQEPEEIATDVRSTIVLNGVWRFQPATATETSPTASEWGLIRVPGAWTMREGKTSFRTPGLVELGQGERWRGLTLVPADRKNAAALAVESAWLSRPLRIPASWAGRSAWLVAERPSMRGTVYLDGKSLGTLAWPGGEVELTSAMRPGTEQVLTLRLDGRGDEREVVQNLGTHYALEVKRQAETARGLLGDISLVSRPRGPVLSAVGVRTSVQRRELSLDLEFSGLTAAGPMRVEVQVEPYAGGKPELTFTSEIVLDPQQPRATVSAPWADPKLWDIARPHRYAAVITVTGSGLRDRIRQVFGFRELQQKSRDLTLNGIPLKLFAYSRVLDQQRDAWGSPELVRRYIGNLQAAGFNTIECWPGDNGITGTADWHEALYEEADRVGMLVIGNLGSSDPFASTWERGGQEAWEAWSARCLERARNHPSVIAWGHSGNRWNVSHFMDPALLGDAQAMAGWLTRKDANWARRTLPLGQAVTARLKALDPTRPVIVHGGVVGDWHCPNFYPLNTPFQEQEEWLSRWLVHGTMPFFAVESGPMAGWDLRRFVGGAPWNRGSEDWTSEYAAALYGPWAYSAENPAIRASHAARLIEGQQYKTWIAQGRPEDGPVAARWEIEGLTRLYRAWRTAGVSTLPILWECQRFWDDNPLPKDQLTQPAPAPGTRGVWLAEVPAWYGSPCDPARTSGRPRAEAVVAAQRPAFAWIGAPQENASDPVAFTAKDANVLAGGSLQKNLWVINDGRAAVAYDLQWQVRVADRSSAPAERRRGQVAPGQRLAIPVTITAPKLAAPTSGILQLSGTVGDTATDETFAFRIQTSPPVIAGSFALSDRAGDTARLLKRLGATTTRWQPHAATELLIVGRRELSSGALQVAELEVFLRRGGRALIAAQDPEWLRTAAGFRVGRRIMRQAFPLPQMPELSDITAADLRDWTGHSLLIPPYDTAVRDTAGRNNGFPPYGWQWSGRGGVLSAPLEVPHQVGFTPALAADFDLASTGLLSARVGLGAALWCTLDLEDHADDPAALRTAAAVLALARSQPVGAPIVPDYVGGDSGHAQVAQLGVALAPNPQSPVVIIGEGTIDEAAVLSRVAAGATALILPRRDQAFGLARTDARSDGALEWPTWPELRGLLPGELRTRAPQQLILAQASPGWKIAANGLIARRQHGRGTLLAWQADATALPVEQSSWQRFTRWRFTRALAQVVTNLGVAGADRLLHPTPQTHHALAGTWQNASVETVPGVEKFADALPDTPWSPVLAAVARGETAALTWKPVNLPGDDLGNGQDWATVDGRAIYRTSLIIPAAWSGRDLTLHLGAIDDSDVTYVNGTEVGRTNLHSTTRIYRVPAALIPADRTVTIVVGVQDRFAGGGFTSPAQELWLRPADSVERPGGILYHADYRADFALGDTPYRYYGW